MILEDKLKIQQEINKFNEKYPFASISALNVIKGLVNADGYKIEDFTNTYISTFKECYKNFKEGYKKDKSINADSIKDIRNDFNDTMEKVFDLSYGVFAKENNLDIERQYDKSMETKSYNQFCSDYLNDDFISKKDDLDRVFFTTVPANKSEAEYIYNIAKSTTYDLKFINQSELAIKKRNELRAGSVFSKKADKYDIRYKKIVKDYVDGLGIPKDGANKLKEYLVGFNKPDKIYLSIKIEQTAQAYMMAKEKYSNLSFFKKWFTLDGYRLRNAYKLIENNLNECNKQLDDKDKLNIASELNKTIEGFDKEKSDSIFQEKFGLFSEDATKSFSKHDIEDEKEQIVILEEDNKENVSNDENSVDNDEDEIIKEELM